MVLVLFLMVTSSVEFIRWAGPEGIGGRGRWAGPEGTGGGVGGRDQRVLGGGAGGRDQRVLRLGGGQVQKCMPILWYLNLP